MTDWILIVAGGILQIPAVNAAHELGYKVVVTDRDLECAGAGLADHFVELDTFDVEGHLDFIKSWPYGFAAVFTAGADPIVTVARAAEAAGCHGIDWGIAITCQRKHSTRLALWKAKIPQPDFVIWSCDSGNSYGTKKIEIGYRLIVKSTTSSGSRGHTR